MWQYVHLTSFPRTSAACFPFVLKIPSKEKNEHSNNYEFWFDFCFTALQHILGHFGRRQLT